MVDFEVTMMKTSTKLQILKITRKECHRVLQGNKIKEVEMHLKTFENV